MMCDGKTRSTGKPKPVTLVSTVVVRKNTVHVRDSFPRSMSQVNRALKGHNLYPVQFSVQPDRAWKAYSQFVPGNDSPSGAGGTFGIVQRAIAKAFKAFGR